MANFLIHALISNVLMSAGLALIAWIVQRRCRSAALANLLWGLVLVKMVTPPILAIPVLEVPSVSALSLAEQPSLNPVVSTFPVEATGTLATSDHSGAAMLPKPSVQATVATESLASRVFIAGPLIWLTISGILLAASSVRIMRFHWGLKASLVIDGQLTQTHSSEVAKQFQLSRVPKIIVTPANIAPFVWWMAGRAVIVVSKRATRELDHRDLRLVITHEMAHIKRRDHWFRWVEWMALVGFWWNPVIWWARQQLRISEEKACDELVLEQPGSDVNQYANSMLNVAELLALSATRPPILASALNSGGSLEERLKTMMTGKSPTVPTLQRMAIMAVTICALPLGFVYAQDYQAVERRLGGAVEAGELSLQQAAEMMHRLRETTESRHTEAKEREFRHMAERVEAAVEAGEISEEEAAYKIDAIRRSSFARRGQPDHEHNAEAREHQLRRMVDQVEAALRAGKLSEEDAEYKINAVRRGILEQGGERDHEHNAEAKERQLRRMVYQVEAALKAGKLSEEDAEHKINAMRRGILEQRGERDHEHNAEANERQLRKLVDQVEAALEAGKLTEEEAEHKIDAVRRGMLKKRDKPEPEHNAEAKEHQLRRRMVDQIEAALEAAKLSEEEAEHKINAVRRGIVQQHGEHDHQHNTEAKQRELMHSVEDLTAAVQATKLAEEHADYTLKALRRGMIEQNGKPEHEHNVEANERLSKRRAEMAEAVAKAARLAQKQAEVRMHAIRQNLFEQRNESADAPSVKTKKQPAQKPVKKTEAGVEAGERSEGEAKEELIERDESAEQK